MKLLTAAGISAALLLASGAEAQVAVTKCSEVSLNGVLEPKVQACDSIVNSDLSLPPGRYSVNIVVQDSAGNRSAPVAVGTFAIIPQDTAAPVVEDAVLVPVSDVMYKAVYRCRDDVKCDGAEVTVTPIP